MKTSAHSIGVTCTFPWNCDQTAQGFTDAVPTEYSESHADIQRVTQELTLAHRQGRIINFTLCTTLGLMSLYIGNLSVRTRRDELERVFSRFGRCKVDLKRDGYGFVVYDIPPNAEKALRALQGRNICGEPLTLTWSNKQPKPFQRFAGGARTYDSQHERNSDTVGYARRRLSSNGWRNYRMGNDIRAKSIDMHHEERGYHQEDFDVGQEKDYRGDYHDDCRGIIPNLEDNGRWGESIHDPSSENGNENAMKFDRYEPYHGYDRKYENENHQIGYSGGSTAGNSQEDMGRAHVNEETSNYPDDSGYRCYKCGESGHRMRNCPKKHASQGKLNSLDGGQGDKVDKKHRVEDEFKKFGSNSYAKLQSSGDTLPMRQQRNEQRLSGSRHYRELLKNELSPVAKETDGHRRKDYGRMKRIRKETEAPKRPSTKKAKRSISSSLRSDRLASHSRSISSSSKSMHRSSSRSRSRAVSSTAQSLSSKSRYSRSGSPNSRKSSSPTSLSVSLNPSLASSPNKVQLNSKGPSIDATAPRSSDHLSAQGQQIESDFDLNHKSKDTNIAVNGNDALYTKVVDDLKKDHYAPDNNNQNLVLFDQSNEVTDLTKPLTDNGTSAAGSSAEIVRETESFQPSGTLMMEDMPVDIKKSALETHSSCQSAHSTTLSSEEMCMVLKHYGLELPNDDEKNLTADAFFGSARMWPWHIIYYRRLKKGPTSTENYARRIAQNKEFGIVDKYIRSSSGWGELSLEEV
ncbi:hypothetical protein L6164_033946 [Bauhinia variegata]|uniref:Uncharacterized protein n=1 Tax=Bauhinia variegata TaxID=167791 RepID=A0ACB9KTF5_BAUVA|nr:hypothetical protein L6164_033946 [Bauhinia variegata]